MDIVAKIPWLVWALLLIVSAVYVIIGAQAFGILGDIEDLYERSSDGGSYRDQVEANLRGGRAALVLSMIGVIMYVVYTFVMTYRKWFSEATLKGVMFGILLTASLYTSVFMLLTGIILEANDLTVKSTRSDETLRVFRASFVVAYAMTAVYVLMCLFHLYRRIVLVNDWTQPGGKMTLGMTSTQQGAV